MLRFSRVDLISLAAVVVFAAAAFLPLWKIEIWAPQYPEGLLMQIGSYWIAGDLQQINILNHYIGMKAIDPTEFVELKIAPWVWALLSLLGVVAVLTRKYRLFRSWFLIVLVSGVLGIGDLYRWGYDFGHNLSAAAPIKIPGMSYQPPLIGEKVLLNIHSFSLPDIGAYFLFASLLLALAGILWNTLKSSC